MLKELAHLRIYFFKKNLSLLFAFEIFPSFQKIVTHLRNSNRISLKSEIMESYGYLGRRGPRRFEIRHIISGGVTDSTRLSLLRGCELAESARPQAAWRTATDVGYAYRILVCMGLFPLTHYSIDIPWRKCYISLAAYVVQHYQ